jgi:hypothetical protein
MGAKIWGKTQEPSRAGSYAVSSIIPFNFSISAFRLSAFPFAISFYVLQHYPSHLVSQNHLPNNGGCLIIKTVPFVPGRFVP